MRKTMLLVVLLVVCAAGCAPLGRTVYPTFTPTAVIPSPTPTLTQGTNFAQAAGGHDDNTTYCVKRTRAYISSLEPDGGGALIILKKK